MSTGFRCAICGKKRVFGRSVSHSGVRTPRIFKPNLQWKRLFLNGQTVRIRLCTKCLKRLKKNGKVVSKPQIAASKASPNTAAA